MKIIYICHSSFYVEFENEKIIILFDYYKGNLPEFDRDSKLFIFVSHKHFDHYSRKIFELANEYENITFILPKEMKMTEKYMDRWDVPVVSRDKIRYVTYDSEYELNGMSDTGKNMLRVKTLKSTDAGVAYLIECAGKTIYHAGDLNWWIWNELSDEKNADMTQRFQSEISKLKDIRIDVAFLPLDYRQEEQFYWGFDYFMRNCEVKVAFPMHLWEKYEVIDKLKKMDISLDYREKIKDIYRENQVFEIV